MGVDIHMNLVHNGEVLEKEIFEGRNSEWFANLQGEGWDNVYDFLPSQYGFSPQTPQDIIDKYDEWTYGKNYINVKDFMNWFEKYRPDLNAGWVTRKEAWEIKMGRYNPDSHDLLNALPTDAQVEDWVFIEDVKDPWDCSAWLYDYIIEHKIPKSADITYSFDH